MSFLQHVNDAPRAHIQGIGNQGVSTESVPTVVPPTDTGPNAISRGANNLGTIVQYPNPPLAPPPPVPPPTPPYLAGLGSYGSSTADVGAYPVSPQPNG